MLVRLFKCILHKIELLILILEAELDISNPEDPLLPKGVNDGYSDKKVNNTITSMDSALSNSDNCSDIELDNIKFISDKNSTTTNNNNINNNNNSGNSNNSNTNSNGGVQQ